MHSVYLLAALIIPCSVLGSPMETRKPTITLPISRPLNFTGGVQDFARHDRERANALRRIGSSKSKASFDTRGVVNQAITNVADCYTAAIGVGSPPTEYNLIVDTGSSNTWVGSGKPYVRTSTSINLGINVSVDYGSATMTGVLFSDVVTLTTGLDISMLIGVSTRTTNFIGFDGVLGIGPKDLTEGTLSPPNMNVILPTVTDVAFEDGLLNQDQVALSFEPTFNINGVVNGEITWGGSDSSKFIGSPTSIPVTTISPSSEFWGLSQTIRYGATNTILVNKAGIIDSGSTLISIASDAYGNYTAATGAVFDDSTRLLSITPAQFRILQSLFFFPFTNSGIGFELTPNAQLWPRALNVDIGGVTGGIYLIIADLGTPSGLGFDFVLGYTFLERFYTIYNTGSKIIGIANTPFTNATTN